MATSALPPGAPFARLDEVKRLQVQVDQMKERLDFISPMVPLVNFCQDYFQRVECEASVQMMRLKNSQVMLGKNVDSEDEMSNAQLETVKWLHFMTDAIIANAKENGAGAPLTALPTPTSSFQMAPRTALPTPTSSPQPQLSAPRGSDPGGYGRDAKGSDAPRGSDPGGYGRDARGSDSNSPGIGSAFPSLGGMMDRDRPTEDSAGLLRRMDIMDRRISHGQSDQSPSLRPYDSGDDKRQQDHDDTPPRQFSAMPRADNQPSAADRARSGQLPSQMDRRSDQQPLAQRAATDYGSASRPDSILSSMTPGGPSGSNALGSLGIAANAAAQAKASYMSPVSSGGPLRYLNIGTEEPLAEPGTGSTDQQINLEGIAMSGSGGLIMGRGSWATAYRQASGHRREALRLLCTSGIVTARELSDDLTVISEEHIEECVQIATEMLQTWTLEMWARQPQEAKKFFEARLTAMYQRKFGEQKGP